MRALAASARAGTRAKGKRTHASTASDGTRWQRAHARSGHIRGHVKNKERAHSARRWHAQARSATRDG
eukprot:1769739-Pleurochrysis_carterae.AAC.1